MSKKCKTCKWRDDGECTNKHFLIGDNKRCKGCGADVWLNDEGADVGKDLDEMEKIINEVREGLWVETDENFGCIHWEKK